MSVQTVSTDHWEAQLPEDWFHKPGQSERAVYFESPDHTAGVYLSTWRPNGQTLVAAARDAQAAVKRNLPTADDSVWEILKAKEDVSDAGFDLRSEYFNRKEAYRIESRILGRTDYYVLLNFHDYDCADPAASAARWSPWVESLRLTEATIER